MQPAKYFKKTKGNTVECKLCPHNCKIKEGNTGICQARVNDKGELYSKNYGQVSSIGMDPVEKKPLYHFYPASDILSIGTFGCNFSCKFCQNWQISQQTPDLRKFNPREIVDIAMRKDAIGIAYTYSEPLIWFEFVLETSKLARKNDLKNVLVSNGFINHEPLKELTPYINAANIDVKSFKTDFYQKHAKGRLKPVLENVEFFHQNNVHIELTTLIITDLNDGKDELKELFSWIKNLDSDIPLHLSRYFPNYKMEKPRTSKKTMKMAYDLAKKYLQFVYPGNIRVNEGQDTICPECQTNLINRNIYHSQTNLKGNKCPECGYRVPGEFS